MSYKKIQLLSILLSGIIQLNAQGSNIKVIQMKLKNEQPAVKATVIVGKLGETGRLKTLLTDQLGMIHLRLDSLYYSLYATYTGMLPIFDTLKPDSKIDTIQYTFLEQINELAEVLVNSRKKILEVKENRFIYNVSSDSSAQSKSLSQILGNLPFVTVTGLGEVQVAGQNSYRVLMNGKETALFVSSIAQALRSFPAEIVARIELITAPGAKYDAEGITAIINIITKKYAGYKGFYTIYASNLTHFSSGLTLTGRVGKLGITINTKTDGTWKPLQEYRSILTTPLSISTFKERMVKAIDENKKLSNSGTVELNYEIDSLHSLIGYITMERTSNNNKLNQEIYTQLNASNTVGSLATSGSEGLPLLTAGLDYTKKSKINPTKELSIRFNWRGTSNLINNTTNQQYEVLNKWMINQSVARNDEYTFQLDATPMVTEKYTLEAGVKSILRNASTNYTSLFTFNRDSNYTKDVANSNNFNYNQQVYAAYGSLSAKIGKNSFRIGIRLEQTNIKGLFSNFSDPVNNNYLSLIPNLYWSRKTGNYTSASIAYNLNLLRPYITNLNPFVNNIDSFNISYGNPKLGPQQVHKIVAQVRYNKENLFATTTLMMSISNKEILTYQLFNTTTGITEVTYGNVGKEQLISIGGSINYQFSKKFKAGIWGDIRYVDIKNLIIKQQFTHGYSGIVGSFFNWDFANRFSLSGSGGVDVRNVSLLGRRSPYVFYQINSGYHIIKNKLFATVNWNNLHNDYYNLRTTFQDNTVLSETSLGRLYRVIFIGFQYTFGKLREEVKRKKGIVNDDIL